MTMMMMMIIIIWVTNITSCPSLSPSISLPLLPPPLPPLLPLSSVQYEEEKQVAQEEIMKYKLDVKRKEQEVKACHSKEIASLKGEVQQAKARFEKSLKVSYLEEEEEGGW